MVPFVFVRRGGTCLPVPAPSDTEDGETGNKTITGHRPCTDPGTFSSVSTGPKGRVFTYTRLGDPHGVNLWDPITGCESTPV